MVEESSPLVPPAEETIEAETDALDPERESGEPAPEPASVRFDCSVWMRWACTGLAFYKEHEGKRYCVLHYPGKEKRADFKAALHSKLNKKDFDFRGVWFPDPVDFRGFEFSAEADFSSATFSAEADFSSATFSAAAYFSSATFSEAAYFSSATFSAAASFSSATFSAAASFSSATFSAAASFRSATFSAAASFSSATFSAAAYFSSATFSADAYFSSATFSAAASFSSAAFSADAAFSSATFSAAANFSEAAFSAFTDFSEATFIMSADFSYVTFSGAAYFYLSVFHARADFGGSYFKDSLHFFGSVKARLLEDYATMGPFALGKDRSLDFQHVRIEHSNRVAFHTLDLRPHWLVNVDPREFVFTDVDWRWDRISINEEIAALEAREVSSPNRLLAITCRQLAENAETNNRYEEASNFRYWAMELQRQEMDPIWKEEWYEFAFWRLDWWYWATSGYGERIVRAFLMLIGIWAVFFLLYTQVGFTKPESKTPTATPVIAAESDTIGQPLALKSAWIYSLAVMSLQKPEPKPLTGTAQTFVLLETILGPVQAALLALAIRRKFMR